MSICNKTYGNCAVPGFVFVWLPRLKFYSPWVFLGDLNSSKVVPLLNFYSNSVRSKTMVWSPRVADAIFNSKIQKILRRRRTNAHYRRKLEPKMKIFKLAKIDHKPWTIVHGLDRFWSKSKLLFFFLNCIQRYFRKTLREIGRLSEGNWNQK